MPEAAPAALSASVALALSAIPPGRCRQSPTDDFAFFPADFASSAAEWYCARLDAMREPSLWRIANERGEAIRFLWLRTFHQPIAVRLQRVDGAPYLFATIMTGAGGYDAGTIAHQRTLAIREADWQIVEQALSDAQLDSMPPEISDVGIDGATWILERATRGSHRFVKRWSPEESGRHAAFRHACVVLLDLAGRDMIAGLVY